MAAENDVLDNEQQEVAEEETGRRNFLQSNVVKTIIRFLGWGVAILIGIALMILTQIIVLDLRGDDPEDKGIMHPDVIGEQPIYGTHTLDQFTINLDKMEGEEITTLVTAQLVLAYPMDNDDIASELAQRKEQLSDAIQSIIARKKFEDINTAEKRENSLKPELINEVNRNLVEKGIVDIWVTKFEIARF